MRVNEYKVIFNVEGQPFDELVTECLNDGWNLHGTPWAHQESGSDIVTLYQAIIRQSNIVFVEQEEGAETEEAAASTEEGSN